MLYRELGDSNLKPKNEHTVQLPAGIHINNNLNYEFHVNQLCKKASKKLNELLELLSAWALINE